MYKMITIDVDDTLMNDDRIVTEGTKASLAAAMEKGVIVTLATGRMFDSAQKVAKQINLNVPIITYQGSLVKTLFDESVLYERSVPQAAAEFLFDLAEARGLHLQAYSDDKFFAKEYNDKVKAYSEMSKIPYYIEPDFRTLLTKPLTKLLIYDEPAFLDELSAELQQKIGDQIYITKSKPYFLEFLHKEGTKGHAVEFLAGHFGCELSEVIAIGDSWNDREMLETAGLGVAMGNAVESLKQIADYVTLTNNEEGVKHVIEKFILNQS